MTADDRIQELSERLERLLPARGKRIALELATGDVGLLPIVRGGRGEHYGPFWLWEEGTTLGLRTIRDGVPLEGVVSLGGIGDRRDTRFSAYVQGLVLGLRRLIELETPRIIEHWAIGWLDVRLPLGVLPEGTTAERYRDYFLTAPWFGWLVDVPPEPLAWIPAPVTTTLNADGSLDLYALRHWIGQHVRRTFSDRRWDEAMRRSVPEPVRVLSAIDTLDAMVGGSGFEVYLVQETGTMVREIHHALTTIDAPRMLRAMNRGIALAARQGAPFTRERARKWLDAFDDPAPSWEEIDRGPEGSFSLLEAEVLPAAERYAEKYRAILIDLRGELTPSSSGRPSATADSSTSGTRGDS